MSSEDTAKAAAAFEYAIKWAGDDWQYDLWTRIDPDYRIWYERQRQRLYSDFQAAAEVANVPTVVVAAVRSMLFWADSISAGDSREKTDALANQRIAEARRLWYAWMKKTSDLPTLSKEDLETVVAEAIQAVQQTGCRKVTLDLILKSAALIADCRRRGTKVPGRSAVQRTTAWKDHHPSRRRDGRSAKQLTRTGQQLLPSREENPAEAADLREQAERSLVEHYNDRGGFYNLSKKDREELIQVQMEQSRGNS
jgi:hypothetical protein